MTSMRTWVCDQNLCSLNSWSLACVTMKQGGSNAVRDVVEWEKYTNAFRRGAQEPKLQKNWEARCLHDDEYSRRPFMPCGWWATLQQQPLRLVLLSTCDSKWSLAPELAVRLARSGRNSKRSKPNRTRSKNRLLNVHWVLWKTSSFTAGTVYCKYPWLVKLINSRRRIWFDFGAFRLDASAKRFVAQPVAVACGTRVVFRVATRPPVRSWTGRPCSTWARSDRASNSTGNCPDPPLVCRSVWPRCSASFA